MLNGASDFNATGLGVKCVRAFPQFLTVSALLLFSRHEL